MAGYDFSGYGVVVNAAAYTAVDAAETEQGRRDAWATNVTAVGGPGPRRAGAPHDPGARLLRLRVRRHRREPRRGRAVLTARRLRPDQGGRRRGRGDGAAALPAADQLGDRGREELRRAPWRPWPTAGSRRVWWPTSSAGSRSPTRSSRRSIHLLAVAAPYGTYNVSNGGPVTSWADVAKAVYAGRGQDPALVRRGDDGGVRAGKDLAPRPRHSALDLAKITATGFRASAGSGSAGRVPGWDLLADVATSSPVVTGASRTRRRSEPDTGRR